MTEHPDAPKEIVDRLGSICLAFPGSSEEQAWVGTRWRIRKRTFAHVLTIDSGWPPAYARAVGSDGPITVLTFRSPVQDIDAFRHSGPPFFLPGWWNDIGMVVDGGLDWRHVAELLTESYCVLAPKKLVALVNRPI
jgi:hypothetical protein